jgi:hypothetical protein
MRRPIFLALFLFALAVQLKAQGIRGEIRDMEGEPVPFAAIFIKELTRGTTCNMLGSFSLPLPEGTYTIYFRSLGYTEVSRKVEVGTEFIEMNISLPPQTYMIPEVRVSATGEDPAYWIMRKAIGLANYHLNEVSRYEAEIYIKGSAIVDRIPNAIEKRIEMEAEGVKIEEGEAYMLESLNEVQFTAPDRYDMKVIASQNTLPGYTENVNPMDYINASLYEQEIEGVVSPLARNAFSHYRYEFEGTFMEGTYVVNKIRVIPKRKSQQLVSGTLFIVEDVWCLHSADLSVKTMAGTIYLQQLYANVIMDAWLPVNHQLKVDLSIIGIKARVNYVSSLEYADVTLNPNLPETYFTSMNQEDLEETGGQQEPLSREEEKINELLQKEELNNREVMRLSRLMEKETRREEDRDLEEELDQSASKVTVARDAVKNDSIYWNKVRPIPLTPEEHLRLRERDSIMGFTVADTSRADTIKVSPKRKKRTLRGIALGKSYLRDRGQFRFSHGGLFDLEMVGYNTVDGLSYGQDFRLNWKTDSLHTLRSRLVVGYAFHRKAPLLTWNTNLLYAPLARGKVGLDFTYSSRDFNGNSGIPNATNMLYTLLYRENHLKMYELLDATLYNRIDIRNGWVFTASATYGQQRQLSNHSDFSIFFRKSKDFSANTPGDYPEDDPTLGDKRFLRAVLRLDITPRHYYVIRNYRKAMRDSRWPTFSMEYRQGIPLGDGNWSDFSQLWGGITHNAQVGLLSELDWSLESGLFLRKESLHFSDFKHFKSSPLIFDMADFDHALMLMDYYEASTSEYWTRADVTLTSSYLLIKFLPWFSERLWKESLGVSYLYTDGIPHYLQLGYSMNEIFFMVDIGAYVAFQDWGYKGFGARLNFRF